MIQMGVNFLLPRIEVSIHKYAASWIYYYSFNPQIANHEREKERAATLAPIYCERGMDVLFAIVSFTVRANFEMSGAEASSLARGALANDTIAAVYLRPDTVCNGLQRNLGTVWKISLAILLISMALTIVSLVTGGMRLLMVSTLLLAMLLVPIVFATAAGNLATTGYSKFAKVSPASKYTPMRR
jgi:hypothetical protein